MTAYGLNSGSSRSEAIIQNAVEIMNRGDAEFPPRRGGGDVVNAWEEKGRDGDGGDMDDEVNNSGYVNGLRGFRTNYAIDARLPNALEGTATTTTGGQEMNDLSTSDSSSSGDTGSVQRKKEATNIAELLMRQSLPTQDQVSNASPNTGRAAETLGTLHAANRFDDARNLDAFDNFDNFEREENVNISERRIHGQNDNVGLSFQVCERARREYDKKHTALLTTHLLRSAQQQQRSPTTAINQTAESLRGKMRHDPNLNASRDSFFGGGGGGGGMGPPGATAIRTESYPYNRPEIFNNANVSASANANTNANTPTTAAASEIMMNLRAPSLTTQTPRFSELGMDSSQLLEREMELARDSDMVGAEHYAHYVPPTNTNPIPINTASITEMLKTSEQMVADLGNELSALPSATETTPVLYPDSPPSSSTFSEQGVSDNASNDDDNKTFQTSSEEEGEREGMDDSMKSSSELVKLPDADLKVDGSPVSSSSDNDSDNNLAAAAAFLDDLNVDNSNNSNSNSNTNSNTNTSSSLSEAQSNLEELKEMLDRSERELLNMSGNSDNDKDKNDSSSIEAIDKLESMTAELSEKRKFDAKSSLEVLKEQQELLRKQKEINESVSNSLSGSDVGDVEQDLNNMSIERGGGEEEQEKEEEDEEEVLKPKDTPEEPKIRQKEEEEERERGWTNSRTTP